MNIQDINMNPEEIADLVFDNLYERMGTNPKERLRVTRENSSDKERKEIYNRIKTMIEERKKQPPVETVDLSNYTIVNPNENDCGRRLH